MLDTLTSDNWRDFGPRYVETYAFFIDPKTSKRRLVFISNSTMDEVQFRTGADSMDFNIKRDSGVMFEFIPVDRAWMLGKSGVPYFLQRVPARQWRRGISRHNTNINILTSYGLEPVNPSWKTMKDIFGDDATQPCKLGEVLSKHFMAVHNGPLYFYREPVGTTVKQGNHCIIKLPAKSLVAQEVMDVLRRTGKDKDYTLEIAHE